MRSHTNTMRREESRSRGGVDSDDGCSGADKGTDGQASGVSAGVAAAQRLHAAPHRVRFERPHCLCCVCTLSCHCPFVPLDDACRVCGSVAGAAAKRTAADAALEAAETLDVVQSSPVAVDPLLLARIMSLLLLVLHPSTLLSAPSAQLGRAAAGDQWLSVQRPLGDAAPALSPRPLLPRASMCQ